MQKPDESAARVDEHLSQIETMWTAIRQAHGGEGASVGAAQERLLHRYSLAVHRYLRGALRDADAADEVFQEFTLRFVRGDFKRADPQKGKFRRFVKTALYHLVIDHQRRRRAQPLSLTPGVPEPVAEPESLAESEARFVASWRAELVRRASEALAEFDRQKGQQLCTVLRLRADNPGLRSAELAERLSADLGQEVTDGWVRKRLHQAREKLADLLLDEVARSIESSSIDELEEEVIELGLLEHCRAALNRRR
jgi:RNA polymerase sigma-70 factor (ECF subfamily)